MNNFLIKLGTWTIKTALNNNRGDIVVIAAGSTGILPDGSMNSLIADKL